MGAEEVRVWHPIWWSAVLDPASHIELSMWGAGTVYRPVLGQVNRNAHMQDIEQGIRLAIRESGIHGSFN